MREGLVKIARYPDEFSAHNARQFLIDSGITAEVFKGGFIAYMEQFELFVPAEKADEARELIDEFEAGQAEDVDSGADEQDEHPEADCEGKS